MWIRTMDDRFINTSAIEQVSKEQMEIWAYMLTVEDKEENKGLTVVHPSIIQLGAYASDVEAMEAYDRLWAALCCGVNHDMREV